MDKSAKGIIKHHKGQLLEKLPLEREQFLTKLENSELLPNSSGTHIRTKITREEKVSYFLEYIVIPGADDHLPKLINVMEQSDDLAVKRLGSDMRKHTKSGRIF